MQAFADERCDELILFPSSKDPAQVDLLADAVAARPRLEPSCTSDCSSSFRRSARTSRSLAAPRTPGFDSAWAPEFHNHSGPLALAAAAVETERIELGTAIAWAFGRSPLLTAVTALDLDEMSGGRFLLGLGTGTRRMRTDWLGAPAEKPATRMRETIEAVRAVWASREHRRRRLRGRAREAEGSPLRPRRPGPRERPRLRCRGQRRNGSNPRHQARRYVLLARCRRRGRSTAFALSACLATFALQALLGLGVELRRPEPALER